MSSVEKDIIHDHLYLSAASTEKEPQPAKASDAPRRSIRKKDDVETEEDWQVYSQRRRLNNASCRISRIHRRTKLELTFKKCAEYEELNARLNLQQSVLFEVINRLKEHLRSLVSDNARPS